MNEQVLEDLFSYHPPRNEDEQRQHEVVNKATIAYAKALATVVNNPADLTVILREIQGVRMLANQSVCHTRMGISYRQLFD